MPAIVLRHVDTAMNKLQNFCSYNRCVEEDREINKKININKLD